MDKTNFPFPNTSCTVTAGWDAPHCHLVSMVTCCYGNMGGGDFVAREAGGGEDRRETWEKKTGEKRQPPQRGKKVNWRDSSTVLRLQCTIHSRLADFHPVCVKFVLQVFFCGMSIGSDFLSHANFSKFYTGKL